MTLLLASERDSDREASALAMMNARSVAGILIVPTSANSVSQLQKLQARGIPVVMLDRIFPGLQAGEVMVENEKGAQMAVMHLLEHGHRSILCVAYDSQFNSITQRMGGYKKTMTEAGLWDTSKVEGLGRLSLLSTDSHNPPTLVIRPWHQASNVVSLREFSNTAYNHHHGIQSTERFGRDTDPDGDGFRNELTRADVTALSVWQATLTRSVSAR